MKINLYILPLILSFLTYIFTISVPLFAWLYPDEILLSEITRSRGFLGCIKFYYTETTVHRIGNIFGGCFMALNANLFFSEFYGWVVIRLLIYLLFPLAISSVLTSRLNLSISKSLIVSLIISSLTIFIVSDSNDNLVNMYGLELSSYALATITFLYLIAYFPNSHSNNLKLFFIFILLFLCITSFEAFIVICSIFVLNRFFVKYNKFGNFLKFLRNIIVFIKTDYISKILLFISVLGFLSITLSPAYLNRQNLIESSHELTNGIIYILLNFEETTYLLFKSKYILALIVLMAIFLGFTQKEKLHKNTVIYLLPLFFSPILYSLIVNYLLSTNKEYWVSPLKPENFMIFHHILTDNDKLVKGAVGLRQNFFLMSSIYLNIFVITFLISKKITSKLKIKFSFKEISSFITICFVSLTLFIFNPDSIGAIKIFNSLLNKEKTKLQDLPNINDNHGYSSFYEFLNNKQNKQIFYERRESNRYQSVVASIIIEKKMRENQFEKFDPLQFQKIFMSDRVSFFSAWRKKIYKSYNLIYENDDFLNLKDDAKKYFIRKTDHFYNNYKLDFLKDKNMDTPNNIAWYEYNNTFIKNKKSRCKLIEVLNDETGFVKGSIYTQKGLNYVVFEYLPNLANVTIEMQSKNFYLTLPLNLKNITAEKKISLLDHKQDSIIPVMRQDIEKKLINELKFIFLSDEAKKITLKWYNNHKNSYICPSYYGSLRDLK